MVKIYLCEQNKQIKLFKKYKLIHFELKTSCDRKFQYETLRLYWRYHVGSVNNQYLSQWTWQRHLSLSWLHCIVIALQASTCRCDSWTVCGNHRVIITVLYLNKNSVMKLVRLSLFDDFDWLSISLCVGLMAGHTL
jgi:hypothetical protein